MRFTAAEVISAEKPESRNTVSPSLSVSWNQSRHVTRLPVQLWKYSCPTTPCTRSKSASVAAEGLASTHEVLNTLRPLFSIAPMLKSLTATMWNTSRSYSRPYTRSSHLMASLSDVIAQSSWSTFSGSDQILMSTLRPEHVVNVLSIFWSLAATSANR